MLTPLGTIRFGWINTAHDAMQEGAVSLLRESPLKRYMNSQHFRISYFSQKEDEEPNRKGCGHFFDMEGLWNPDIRQNPVAQTVSFRQMKREYGPAAQSARSDYFTQQPLTPEAAAKLYPKSAYRLALRTYTRLVEILSGLKQSIDALPPEQELSGELRGKTFIELNEAMGQLSHYVTDLHQPMHTTCYDWQLPNRLGKAHVMLDGTLFNSTPNKQDYEPWLKKMALLHDQDAAKPRILPFDEIKQRLIETIPATFLKIHDLVIGDSKARKKARTFGKFCQPRYEQLLKNAWQPILEAQMTAASKMLATMLKSAFDAAGRPDLDKLFGK